MKRGCLGVGLSLLWIGAVLPAQGSGAEREAEPSSRAGRRAAPDSLQSAMRDAARLADAAWRARGPARSRALELAAAAYDRCVAAADAMPAVSADAAWAAAELWRRQGSPMLAEQDYLYASKRDAGRYGQRGLFGAAEMQRRQQRLEAAMRTYADAERIDPRTGYAHRARLWMARMVLARGAVDRAIGRFQAALESAPTPRRAIEAADLLAKAWIQKGELDSAGFVLDHVDQLVGDHQGGDPARAARLRRASREMSARRALRRALDKARDVAADAIRLDEHLRQKRKEPDPEQLGC